MHKGVKSCGMRKPWKKLIISSDKNLKFKFYIFY